MHVQHYTTFPYGGAGSAARRLHESLVAAGIDSHLVYAPLADPEKCQGLVRSTPARFAESQPAKGLRARWSERQLKRRRRRIHRLFDTHLANRNPDGVLEGFSMAQLVEETRWVPPPRCVDIIHLHWVAYLLDQASFLQSVPDALPIVWTLHDMNPLTGGCHYSGDCSRFTVGCGRCPQVVAPGPRDVSYHSLASKRRALRNKNIHVIAPSQWLSELARASDVFPPHTTYHVIRYGFDLEVFRPIDKRQARHQLGIDTQATLIAFGCEDVTNHRKGFSLLREALQRLPSRLDVECLVFGSGADDQVAESNRRWHLQGYVNDPQRQALIYSAADIYVMPSREDNLPQTGLEALACGTPVVAFPVGGIPEYVLDGRTGLLAAAGDASALADAIARLAADEPRRAAMGRSGVAMMARHFELDRQARLHIDLYEQLNLASLELNAPSRRQSRAA